jgi:hypothetical protein
MSKNTRTSSTRTWWVFGAAKGAAFSGIVLLFIGLQGSEMQATTPTVALSAHVHPQCTATAGHGLHARVHAERFSSMTSYTHGNQKPVLVCMHVQNRNARYARITNIPVTLLPRKKKLVRTGRKAVACEPSSIADAWQSQALRLHMSIRTQDALCSARLGSQCGDSNRITARCFACSRKRTRTPGEAAIGNGDPR